MRLSALLNIRHAPRDFTVYHSGLGKYTTDYSNLPQRYIKKKITKVEWKSPNHPRYAVKCRSFVPRVHNLDRPWTDQYWSVQGLSKLWTRGTKDRHFTAYLGWFGDFHSTLVIFFFIYLWGRLL